MNITDVDDKTIKGANAEKVKLEEFTKKYTDAFFEDIQKLYISKADYYPRATEHIQDMIENGAEACIFVCPACQETMGSKVQRKGLKSYLLSDLARLALGEELDY